MTSSWSPPTSSLKATPKEGLRTLLLASKEMTEQDYKHWQVRWAQANMSITNREELCDEVA